MLRTYREIRRGERVPDREMDRVGAWLKLSGVVCRRGGALAVRNAIYERVFDARWTREHLRLYVNWLRLGARALIVLVVLTALITGPLAFIAWRQMREAQAGRAEAERLRDVAQEQMEAASRSALDAHLARAEAEASANRALATLQAVQSQLAAAGIDDKSLESLLKRIAAERKAAEKQIADRTAQLRAERDSALARLETSETDRARLIEESSRLRSAANAAAPATATPPPASTDAPRTAPQPALTSVPTLVGVSAEDARTILQRSGLRFGRLIRRETSARPGTVVAQSLRPGTVVPPGSSVDLVISVPPASVPTSPAQQPVAAGPGLEITLERVDVRHDSTGGSTSWYFAVFFNDAAALRLVRAIYRDGSSYDVSALGGDRGAGMRSSAPGALRPCLHTLKGVLLKSLRVVGTRQNESRPLTVTGSIAPVSVDAPTNLIVTASADSKNPQDGDFVFHFRVRPVPAQESR